MENRTSWDHQAGLISQLYAYFLKGISAGFFVEELLSKTEDTGEHTLHPSTAVGIASCNSRNLFMTRYKIWQVIVMYFNKREAKAKI